MEEKGERKKKRKEVRKKSEEKREMKKKGSEEKRGKKGIVSIFQNLLASEGAHQACT